MAHRGELSVVLKHISAGNWRLLMFAAFHSEEVLLMCHYDTNKPDLHSSCCDQQLIVVTLAIILTYAFILPHQKYYASEWYTISPVLLKILHSKVPVWFADYHHLNVFLTEVIWLDRVNPLPLPLLWDNKWEKTAWCCSNLDSLWGSRGQWDFCLLAKYSETSFTSGSQSLANITFIIVLLRDCLGFCSCK